MGQNAAFPATVETPTGSKGGKLFRPVNYFLLGFLLLVAIIYRRDPSQRAAFLAVLKDQKAMTFGVLWVIFALATNFVSHGFHDVLNVVIQALISGFAVAAILNWFYKRKTRVK